MKILNLKKNKGTVPPEKTKKVAVKVEKEVPVVKGEKEVSHFIHRIILHPRITEKASGQTEKGMYTFNVSPLANKRNVKEEVARIYKVTPLHVRIAKVPGKVIFSRGKKGTRKAGKKAYVTLKEGERIEFV